MTKSYKHLVEKLNLYIKKYNLFQLFKGLIYFILLIISYFTIISVIEYFVYLSTSYRTFIFFFSIVFFLFIAVFYFILPLLKLFGLLKVMDYERAAFIISEHFKGIDDKLFNIIELAKMNKDVDDALVLASIDEKIDKIKLIDFSMAVSYKKLVNHLVVLFAVGLVSLVLFFSLPGLFTETSKRLADYDQVFVKPAPFTFHLLNDSLKVKKGDQLNLTVKCEGSQIPDILYVNIAGSNFMMNKKRDTFSYQFERVDNSFKVYFTNLVYQSDLYYIKVLPAPVILDYSMQIDPPDYTGFPKEKKDRIGDLKVPYGSEITWVFNTVDTDSLWCKIGGKIISAKKENGKFEFKYQTKSNLNYAVSITNEFFNYKDLLNFNIEIIPDLYPKIEVAQLRDSTDYTRYFFKGSIADDYGFHDLNYHLVVNQDDSLISLPIVKNLDQQDFYFTYDFKDLGETTTPISYYFTVRDNDYFHGFKETASKTFQFVFPSKQEMDKMDDKNYQHLDSLMGKSLQLSSEIQQSIQELKYKNLNGNFSDWEKQQLVSEILNKKSQLQDMLDQVKKKNAEMNNMKNSFSKEKADMIQKQKQIEKLLDDVFNDELKSLFDEFKKLAQKFDQSKFDELSKKSEMSMDDLSKQLERNLQMLKRMKVEQEIEKAIDGLSYLGKKERENAQALDEKHNFEQTGTKEKENKAALKSIADKLKNALDLNETLEKPLNVQPMDEEFNEINSNYNEIGEMLQNKRKRKSVEKIKQNASNYENASFALNQMLATNKKKQNMENIHDLEQLLDNLVYLSLGQEKLYDEVNSIDIGDPKLGMIQIDQQKLIRQSKVVKDSLFALAKRTPAIENVVTKDLSSLSNSMDKAIGALEENQLSNALRDQQVAITSTNNMALFLNEALQNLQKQMADAMPGDGQDDKKGGSKGNNLSMLKKGQQSLKEQLQQMIEQMKNGNGKNMGQQLGKSLAQQEMMQQMIREMMMGNEVGSAAKEQLKQINELLEQNNHDLINKNVTTTMINRQNLILNKLLKAEKAEMERDEDNERESKTASDEFYSNPNQYFKYKNEEKDFKDVIERNNYLLQIFYDRKYKQYINNLRKGN